MIRRAGLTYLVVGMAAMLGASALLVRVADDVLHPLMTETTHAVGVAALSSGPLQLKPGLRAQVQVSWRSHPGTQSSAQSRVCCAIEFVATAGDGKELARDRVLVSADHAAAEPLTVNLSKWQPPATGPVTVTVNVVDAQGESAVADSLTVAVRHGMKDHTVVLILAVFMGVGGVIAFTVGGVRAAIRAPRPVRVPGDPTQIRRAAMLCHLGGLTGFLLPFGNLVAPFVMWIAGRDLDPVVERAGREALNFQLSILFYLLLAFALTLALIGVFILPLLVVMQIVLTIIAARSAAAGIEYRYPLTFRMV